MTNSMRSYFRCNKKNRYQNNPKNECEIRIVLKKKVHPYSPFFQKAIIFFLLHIQNTFAGQSCGGQNISFLNRIRSGRKIFCRTRLAQTAKCYPLDVIFIFQNTWLLTLHESAVDEFIFYVTESHIRTSRYFPQFYTSLINFLNTCCKAAKKF